MSASTATDEQKAYALALYTEHGPAEASRRTGINESTIKSWARRTGVAPVALEKRRAAVEAKRAMAEERKAELRDLLARVAEKGSRKVLELLDGVQRENLRDVVGAVTRAVHDLQLLSGDPTSRTESVTLDAVDAEIAKLRAEMDRADV